MSGAAEARREELIRLYREVETCTRCPLHALDRVPKPRFLDSTRSVGVALELVDEVP